MIEIAKVLKPHGIGGEVKIQLFSDNFEAFCQKGFAYIAQDGAHRRITYTVVRLAPPFVYLRIDGINTRNDAEKLRGVFLYLDRKDFAPAGEDEYYICDLLGMEIVDTGGNKLGTLKDIFQHGAADVYAVAGEKSFMFPALKRVIIEVDPRAGRIRVDEKALSEVAVYDDI